MDIKGVLPHSITLPVGSAKNSTSISKTDADNNKEGNGQSSSGEQQKRKLKPEEIQEAVEYLKALPGVLAHNLNVVLENAGDIQIVKILDPTGKVVRRITESELGDLTSQREKKSGHLLNKAM